MARVACDVIALRRTEDLHDRLGGMTLQVWLEHVGRLLGGEARELLGVVDVLERMPAVRGGLHDGWLSWSQTVAICRAARRVHVGRLAELDDLLAAAIPTMSECEPGAIVDDVWQWVEALQPSRLEREEAAAERDEFLSLQPRLTGGGSFYGELGPVNFATFAESVSTAAPPPAAPDVDPGDLDDDAAADLFDTLDERRRAHTRDHGAAMAARLVDLCDPSHRSGWCSSSPGGPELPPGTRSGRARPLLLATIDLDALCDQTRTPGWLLHTLAGGRMKVSAAALQRLVDERGADLRSIVLDDCGQVVGVGRRTSVPPHWLRQAIWARDLAVRDPDGSCPVRKADLDHITKFPDGATDVANLHPVGRRWHNHKTSKRWAVTRTADGTTTWTHRRHGWTLRRAPARRDLTRPPPTGPPDPPPPKTEPESDPDQPRLTGVP